MKWSIVAVVACATFGAGWLSYAAGKKAGRLEVQAMWDQERAATAQAHAEETMKARQRESALHDLAEKLKKEKRDESLRLSRQFAADLERLRHRPEARAGDSGVPEGAALGVGCTGAGLSRADSEFLVRLGADATRLQSALNQCRAQYAEVERTLNALSP